MRRLDLATLTSLVSALPRFGKISYYDSVESTNAVAVERLYHNDSFGISFVTETQTNGRGRAGRTWFSPPGSGIYCSTILPAELQPASLPAAGFWAALALREACLRETGVALDLKWPNDLLLGGRKCAGILTQSQSVGRATRVVIGMGLNVNRPPQVDPSIAQSAAWLSQTGGCVFDRARILAGLLSLYERDFDRLLNQPHRIIESWARVAGLAGKRVRVKATGGAAGFEGVVKAVDGDGALVLKTSDGNVQRVTLGDVEAL